MLSCGATNRRLTFDQWHGRAFGLHFSTMQAIRDSADTGKTGAPVVYILYKATTCQHPKGIEESFSLSSKHDFLTDKRGQDSR